MHAAALRYVDQVARLGSIRRAAGVLNVASSAVNRQILKLEAEIGTPLFERVGNGVRPTAAGEHVIRHVRETLSRWNDVRGEIATLSGDIHGEAAPAHLVPRHRRRAPRAYRRDARPQGRYRHPVHRPPA